MADSSLKKRWKAWLAVAVLLTAGLTIYAGRPELTPVGTAASQETDRWLSAIRQHAQNSYWIVVRGTHPGDQLVAAASAARSCTTYAASSAPIDPTNSTTDGVRRA